MKKCPKCNSEVEENFESCWNCLYNFTSEKSQSDEDFQLICQKCGTETREDSNFCSNCGNDLSLSMDTSQVIEGDGLQINCLRCDTLMDYKGKRKFQERTWLEAPLFEYLLNKETFGLYICPNCHKMEFYLIP